MAYQGLCGLRELAERVVACRTNNFNGLGCALWRSASYGKLVLSLMVMINPLNTDSYQTRLNIWCFKVMRRV